MSEKLNTYSDPKVGPWDGADNVRHVPFASGTVFRRRGGKAVDLHHRYQAATANSSNLAGFAEVDEVGVSGGHPASVSDGDDLAVNFGLEKTHVFPTSGRAAVESDRGKDFDIAVDANNVQYVDMSTQSNKVLRIVRVLDDDGAYVACSIPTDLRYGNL